MSKGISALKESFFTDWHRVVKMLEVPLIWAGIRKDIGSISTFVLTVQKRMKY